MRGEQESIAELDVGSEDVARRPPWVHAGNHGLARLADRGERRPLTDPANVCIVTGIHTSGIIVGWRSSLAR
jgi:hypothetical protein